MVRLVRRTADRDGTGDQRERRRQADLRRQGGGHAEEHAADDHVDDRGGQGERADRTDERGLALDCAERGLRTLVHRVSFPRVTAERRTVTRGVRVPFVECADDVP